MYEYGLGGQEVKRDASDDVADIPQNRTLMIEKLTAQAPVKPEIVDGLKTVEEVFEHFNPQIECEFQKEDGSFVSEKLAFKNLGDFGGKGITNQSNFLNELQLEKNEYTKLVKQLKSNRQMKSLIENPETREAFLNALQALIQEIDDAK